MPISATVVDQKARSMVTTGVSWRLVYAAMCVAYLPLRQAEDFDVSTTEEIKTYPRMILPEGSNSYMVGIRREGDMLLETLNCVKPVQENGTFEVVLKYPTKSADHTKKITLIQVNDRNTDNKGAWTSIKEGGVNYTEATFAVSSAPGGGMNVSIEVYGM